MQIPSSLIDSLQHVKGFDREAFENVHASGEQVTSIRLNPAKMKGALPFIPHSPQPVPWSSYGYYLAERPSFTFDPLFHAGVYYVQEASSMFLEQALRQTVDCSQSLRVLDLCAAPGGKSTLVQSLINSNSLLVSNDVIKSRAAILSENMTKWGAANVVVTNNDPKDFARLENYFDVIVIDAPCSGSGLFRRDPDAIGEWSENNVALCSQRQQRIIADVWPALKQHGILIYSTCSYSVEEDEMILDWILDELEAEPVSLHTEPSWNIVETNSVKHAAPAYRFYPDKVKGEGLFIAAVKKTGGDTGPADNTAKKKKQEELSRKEMELVRPWLDMSNDYYMFHQGEEIIVMPEQFRQDIAILQTALYIKKAGVAAGKLTAKELLPAHELAMSTIGSGNIVSVPLNRDQSIQYLRKEEVQVDTNQRGWALVQYEGHALGWVKILQNRVNNYYPKEWRILKAV